MWFEIPELSNITKDCNSDIDILYFDFGHGGNDSGCTLYDKTFEKDYNLKIGKKVLDICLDYIPQIYTTRLKDTTVELSDRAKNMTAITKKLGTNGILHVYSFHVNAFNTLANGTEILLSLSSKLGQPDFTWSLEFLQTYTNYFGFQNRGIIQKHYPNKPNTDYYSLHRNTPANCKVKYLELFFGDNKNDCLVGTNSEFIDTAAYFIAAYILKRYGYEIFPKEENNILYSVQVGAYKQKENAENKLIELKKAGFDGYIYQKPV